MNKTHYFKSSLVLAASGLAVNAGHASVTTFTYGGPSYTSTNGAPSNVLFDISGDAVNDYQFHFAAELKPQLYSADGESGMNRIFLNSPAGDDGNTLAVLGLGTVVDLSLSADVNAQSFFYQNWNNNHWGDWGGPGGATAPDPVQGPITGYVGLAIPTDGTFTDYNFGYAHFTVDMTAATPYVTLLDTAYETTVNQAITIAAVPEPSSAALLVTGAAGLWALRRRRARA